MGGEEEAAQVLAAKFAVISPHLDERQRRLLMGAEARALGHGGIRLVARAAGVREATVSLGAEELEAQFRDINDEAQAHQDSGDPVISVDTKKKELIGEFANAGRDWRPKGQPAAVRTHDFPGDSEGKAIPYGVYDVTADTGWVNA